MGIPTQYKSDAEGTFSIIIKYERYIIVGTH